MKYSVYDVFWPNYAVIKLYYILFLIFHSELAMKISLSERDVFVHIAQASSSTQTDAASLIEEQYNVKIIQEEHLKSLKATIQKFNLYKKTEIW